MNKKEIHLKKIQYSSDKQLSKKELEEFLQLITDSECEELFVYRKIVRLCELDKQSNEINSEESWKKISLSLTNTVENSRFLKYKIISIVAIVTLFIGVLGFFHMKRTDSFYSPELTILPDNIRPLLTLSNGEQISLDRIADTLDDIGVYIAKDEDGTLRYDKKQTLPQSEVVYNEIKVPSGCEYFFTMADGSKIWLNAEAEIKFPTTFTGNKRQVYVKGELFFDVYPNKEQPFEVIVLNNDFKIEVLGTSFNVNANQSSDVVTTTLVTGSLQVLTNDSISLLVPGNQLCYDRLTKVVELHDVNTNLYCSWIDGVYEFENLTLNDILNQCARWYCVQFTFDNEQVKKRRFTGMFRKYEPIQDILSQIEKLTNVQFIIDETKIHVKEKL